MKSDKHKLYAHVEFLTSLRPFRNYKEPQALAQASNYIDQAFSQYGLPTEQQTWQVGGQRYLNIVATYNPEKPKRLIIGAHYD
ncbi:MAG TPA: hypothetical protein VL947_09155, partial [Cytophagales bacterium]|nr:hypothetical protein [Cytophagales bacterium]